MASVFSFTFHISNKCPVPWTTTQERSLGREFPFDLANEQAESYARRTYLQSLFLPESIAPLQHLVPSMLRVIPTTGPLFSKGDHPLHKLLLPVLLTPRLSAQKYQTRIPQLLVDEEATPDDEANMLWYAYKFEKTDIEDLEEHEQEAAEEKWRVGWLNRLERREAMIQILLHMLLLSLSEPSASNEEFGSPSVLLSPRKRKRQLPEPNLSYDDLEERLEGFMDKLSMWQLTDSLQNLDSSAEQRSQVLPNTKGKDKQSRGLDRMQIFCEDVVEPIFKALLPGHCDLLRSKVFPHSPFSDDTDTSSPPSPKQQNKRLKASASSSRKTSPQAREMPDGRPLERSRSLSVTLEEERERSRSLSVGPGNMRRRVLTREVSMSTQFKAKPAKTKVAVANEKKLAATAKEQSRRNSGAGRMSEKDKGRTLVAATPVKPKNKSAPLNGSGSLRRSDTIPALSFGTAGVKGSVSVEGGEDDDEWTIASSPDILDWTGSSGRESRSLSVDDSDDDGDAGESRVLVAESPTKPSRTR